MGNLSFFIHSFGFRGFIFWGFGVVTSDDLINQTQKKNPKNATLKTHPRGAFRKKSKTLKPNPQGFIF